MLNRDQTDLLGEVPGKGKCAKQNDLPRLKISEAKKCAGGVSFLKNAGTQKS